MGVGVIFDKLEARANDFLLVPWSSIILVICLCLCNCQSLFLFLFLSVSLCLSFYRSLSLSPSLSAFLFISLSVSFFLYLYMIIPSCIMNLSFTSILACRQSICLCVQSAYFEKLMTYNSVVDPDPVPFRTVSRIRTRFPYLTVSLYPEPVPYQTVSWIRTRSICYNGYMVNNNNMWQTAS